MAAVVRLNNMAADKTFSATFRYLLQGGVGAWKVNMLNTAAVVRLNKMTADKIFFGNVSIPSFASFFRQT